MKKVRATVIFLSLLAVLAALPGCGGAGEDGFNLIFRYGVTARNELNTFEGTYTKDMINDPSVTVALTLTEEELDSIYQKMLEIDFFSYPEEFAVSVPADGITTMVTPSTSYYFKVQFDGQVKELRWDDAILNENEAADRLRELIGLITGIIESKDAYRNLPEPSGGYL